MGEGIEAGLLARPDRPDDDLHRKLVVVAVQRGQLDPLVQHRPLTGGQVPLAALLMGLP